MTEKASPIVGPGRVEHLEALDANPVIWDRMAVSPSTRL
jgi:hypothetical protein